MRKIPQHLSIISLGTNDLDAIRSFYAGWGWTEADDSQATWCAFDVGGTLLSFYSMEHLAEEASALPRPVTNWGGYTLALNLPSEEALAEVLEIALAAGARLTAEPQRRAWGGTSAYISDPDGNCWELATGGPNPTA